MRAVRSFVSAAVLVAVNAIAADTPANDRKPAEPPPEDPIAAAKRDLEAIKAAKGGVQPQGKADLPLLSGSDLAIGPQAPWQPAAPGKSAADAAKKKSANWLVDAMMKKPAASTDLRNRSFTENNSRITRSQPESDDLDPTDLLKTTESASGTATPAATSDRKSSEAADAARAQIEPVNPLANFMAGWMTPQDYKLLQSEPKTDSISASIPPGGSVTPGQAIAPGTGTGAPLFGQAPVGRSAPAPRENPFLQDFTLGLPPPAKTPAQAGAAPSVVSVPAPKALPPPPEPVAQKPATPAFVKPNDDAKYFKPLKRF